MSNVLQLVRSMRERPEVMPPPGLRLRNYEGPHDIEVWLDLRHRAFARQKVGVRRWEAADFQAEFLARPWWDPQRMWFARCQRGLLPERDVGTVALAFRGSGPDAKPVVHWLAVLPEWRRAGVGRLLMSALEAACWDAGYRQVWLETHAAWTAAKRFYEALGYRPA